MCVANKDGCSNNNNMKSQEGSTSSDFGRTKSDLDRSNRAASATSSRTLLQQQQQEQGNRIRFKYLAALGIVPSPPPPPSSHCAATTSVTKSMSRKTGPVTFLYKTDLSVGVPMLTSVSSTCSSSCSSSSSSSSSLLSMDSCSLQLTSCLKKSSYEASSGRHTKPTTTKKRVTFLPVTRAHVFTIPSRHSMSPRTLHKLWINVDEMRHFYVRNMMEYQSENWDYLQALEEDSFHRTATGQLVHPAYFHFLQQQHQLQMQLQQQQQQQVVNHPYHSLFGSRTSCSYNSYHGKAFPVSTGSMAVGPSNLKQHFCRVMSAQQRW